MPYLNGNRRKRRKDFGGYLKLDASSVADMASSADRLNWLNHWPPFAASGMLIDMKAIAEELNRRLAQLDPPIADKVERLVRDALALADGATPSPTSVWPKDYFARTAGALAGEEFERPQQGSVPEREAW